MTTTLLSTGAYAAARNRRRALSIALEQRGQPVEDHLRDEQADEVGRDVLRGVLVGAVGAEA